MSADKASAAVVPERWREETHARAQLYWTNERLERTFGATRAGESLKLQIHPIDDAALVRALGLSLRDGSMTPDRLHKFFQINHILTLLLNPLRDLIATKHNETVRVIDIGCGSSALTLAFAHMLTRRLGCAANVIGIDNRSVVIEKSRERAELAGLSGCTQFYCCNAADLLAQAPAGPPAWMTSTVPPNRTAIVALHACDTASDLALALGLEQQVQLMAIAPCCHAELAAARAREFEAEFSQPAITQSLAAVWRSPHLRREVSAYLTDAMRCALVAGRGYDVSAVEFVRSEHTPKNTLIKAQRAQVPPDAQRMQREHAQLKSAAGEHTLALERLLCASPTSANAARESSP